MSIYEKYYKVMQKIKRVPKNGRNNFHHYDYVTEADLAEMLRGFFIEEGLIVITSVLDMKKTMAQDPEKEMSTTHVKMEFRIIDIETKEEIKSVFWGEGMDKGDKGLYKAYTGAEKYFLMKNFLIPTGDDPERESPEISQMLPKPKIIKNTRQPKAQPEQMLYALSPKEQEKIKGSIEKVASEIAEMTDGKTEEIIKEIVQELYAKENLYDLTLDQARDIFKQLSKKKNNLKKTS